jgi:hypothetical protein
MPTCRGVEGALDPGDHRNLVVGVGYQMQPLQPDWPLVQLAAISGQRGVVCQSMQMLSVPWEHVHTCGAYALAAYLNQKDLADAISERHDAVSAPEVTSLQRPPALNVHVVQQILNLRPAHSWMYGVAPFVVHTSFDVAQPHMHHQCLTVRSHNRFTEYRHLDTECSGHV